MVLHGVPWDPKEGFDAKNETNNTHATIPLTLNRRYFIFVFKGTLSLKFNKTFSNV